MLKRLFCLSLVALLAVFSCSPAMARSHRFIDLVIDAQVGADGLVRVTETHSVKFDGKFSGMYQWFDTSGGVELSNIVVSEGGAAYQRLDTDSPGPAGTYFVRESENEVYVDWSFAASDEVRRFELSYIVHNAILKHNDVAEFYYQFVGDRWDQGRDHVRIVLTLPFGAEPSEVAAWGHGPLDGVVTIESPSKIVWEVDNLPAKTFVEGRAVFPNSLVPLGTRYTGEDRLEAIFAEESAQEEAKAESRRLAQERLENLQRRQALDPYLAAACFALVLVFIINIWTKHGPHGPNFKERYYKELPGHYPPAEMGILLRRYVTGQDFTATLLDLARRGFLAIEEIPGPRGTGKDDASYKLTKKSAEHLETDTLRPYEARLLDLVFEQGDEVTLEDFQEYAKDNAKDVSKFWTEWGTEVQESSKVHNFYDDGAKKALWWLIPTIGLFVLSIFCLALDLLATGVTAMIMFFVAFIVVISAANRRSKDGQEEYRKWQAFRRYLRDFSRVETARVGALGIWEEYLPYAISLGVADQILKQLEVRFPSLADGEYQFASNWFIYYHAGGFARINRMTSKVGESMTKVTMPQGSGGTGGGFSGGGGGGFGGGGGGVR